MLVILAKEEERSDLGEEPLSYTLSEIKVAQSAKKKAGLGFKLDESDDETFEKLKNLAAMEVEKIVEKIVPVVEYRNAKETENHIEIRY